MNKKYEFTGETKEHEGRILRRIRRIEDDLVGGWIESEFNLSQEGNCFIYGNAMVYGNVMVYDNAEVFDNARIFDYAEVCGYAEVYGDAKIYGYAKIFGDAEVFGDAKVYDNAEIYGYAKVFGDAKVYNDARVCGDAKIFGVAKIYEGRIIGQVSQSYKSVFQYQCKNRVLTAILTEEGEILYSIGCQDNITKEVFLDRIYNEDGGLEENPHRKEYLKLIPLIEQYFKN